MSEYKKTVTEQPNEQAETECPCCGLLPSGCARSGSMELVESIDARPTSLVLRAGLDIEDGMISVHVLGYSPDRKPHYDNRRIEIMLNGDESLLVRATAGHAIEGIQEPTANPVQLWEKSVPLTEYPAPTTEVPSEPATRES